tara:strand:- start:422 stop:877 length:456 start_codon:yes stop_codon:yes gene_type:complete
MSENLFVMPSGEALPRCAYCLDRPVLYRLKDYKFSTGDVFDAYFCKDCDGVGQAINHYASRINVRLRITVDPLMEARMVYHNWAATQTEEVLNGASNDRNIVYGNAIIELRHSMIGEPEQKKIDILYGEDAIVWFNDYESVLFNNSRQGDI